MTDTWLHALLQLSRPFRAPNTSHKVMCLADTAEALRSETRRGQNLNQQCTRAFLYCAFHPPCRFILLGIVQSSAVSFNIFLLKILPVFGLFSLATEQNILKHASGLPLDTTNFTFPHFSSSVLELDMERRNTLRCFINEGNRVLCSTY